ncbi:MAG: NDP-sugar synthase [Bdellovibrionales bacterium]|nr:NDP-sugar synthase [Bdellovibrionales bacterium]
MISQALILSAGLSTRMRPLTSHKPKSIVPFLGKRMMDWTCTYLQYYGIKEVACNLYHGKDAFYQELTKKPFPLPVDTFEESTLRNTGGGILGMKPFMRQEHIVVMNCDFLCDINLHEVIESHIQKKSLATMVMVPQHNPNKYSSIEFNEKGEIAKLGSYKKDIKGKTTEGLFCGIHILHREIFELMPQEKSFGIIEDVYVPLLEKGKAIHAFSSNSAWYDLGEIQEFSKNEILLYDRPLSWMKKHNTKKGW